MRKRKWGKKNEEKKVREREWGKKKENEEERETVEEKIKKSWSYIRACVLDSSPIDTAWNEMEGDKGVGMSECVTDGEIQREREREREKESEREREREMEREREWERESEVKRGAHTAALL